MAATRADEVFGTAPPTAPVTPTQWADYRALTGDPADNIPGIGAKTAATLLEGGITLDTLPASGRLDTGQGRTVLDQLDLARITRT